MTDCKRCRPSKLQGELNEADANNVQNTIAVICMTIFFIVVIICMNKAWERSAIEAGKGVYSTTTGQFEWK